MAKQNASAKAPDDEGASHHEVLLPGDHGKVELVVICSSADLVFVKVSPFGLVPMTQTNSDTWRCWLQITDAAEVCYYARFGRLLVRLGDETPSAPPRA